MRGNNLQLVAVPSWSLTRPALTLAFSKVSPLRVNYLFDPRAMYCKGERHLGRRLIFSGTL